MFKNLKLSMKVLLVLILTLGATLVGVGVFSLNKKQPVPDVPTTEVETDTDLSDLIILNVDYGKKENGGASVDAAEQNPQISTNAYKIYTLEYIGGAYKGMPLNADDKLSFYFHTDLKNSYKISFSVVIYSGVGEGYKGTISGVMNAGYEATAFHVGYTSNNKFTYTSITDSGKTMTAAEIDANYSGTVAIRVNGEKSTYTAYGYYRYDDSGEYSYKPTNTTKIEYSSSGGTLGTAPAKDGYDFRCWYLDTYVLLNDMCDNERYWELYYGKSFNNGSENKDEYTPNEGVITIHRNDWFPDGNRGCIKLEVGEAWTYVDEDGKEHICYDIVSISGNARLYQNTDRPFIKACFEQSHATTIEVNATDWEDYSGNIDIKEADLYGIVAQGVYNSSAGTTVARSSKNYNLFVTGTKAFYHKQDFKDADISKSEDETSSYFLYNYGSRIKEYTIQAKFKGDTYYVQYDNGVKLVKTNTPLTISAADIDYYRIGLDKIALALDRMSNTSIPIKITPTWEKVSLTVNGKSVAMFEEYDLGDPTATNAGQTAVCYFAGLEAEKNYVISGGVWNYANIHQEGEGYIISGSGHEGSVAYTLTLGVHFVNNIYKVSLHDKLGDWMGGRQHSESYEIDVDVYTIKDAETSKLTINSSEFGTVDSFGNSGFIDQYLSSIYIPYLDKYETAVSTDNTAEKIFDIFKWVYSDEDQTNWWIYVANNQELVNLPYYGTGYAITTLWRDSGKNLAWTTGQPDTETYSDYNVVERWTYDTETLNLYAFNAYRIKMHQDATASNNYTNDWSKEWFSLKKTAEFESNGLTNSSNGAQASGWIFDTEQARKEGYGVSYAPGILTVSKNGDIWYFTVDRVDDYDENYFFILGVYGHGEFKQLRDESGSKDMPIIRLNISWPNKAQKFNVEKGDTYWDDKTGYESYAGVRFPDGGPTVNNVKATSRIKLMSSYEDGRGLSFDSSDDIDNYDFNGEQYYVYSYGQYITGWTVKIEYDFAEDGVDNIVLYYTASGAKLTATETKVATWNTNGDFGKIVGCINSLYEYYVRSGKNGEIGITVTITPSWELTTVTPYINSVRQNSVVFGDEYDMSSHTATKTGKTFFSLAFVDENDETHGLVNTYGVWNYVTGGNCYVGASDRFYTVDLTDVFVNNIYKLTLNNVYLSERYNVAAGGATVTIKDCGYKYNSEAIQDVACFTYLDIGNYDLSKDDYHFVSFNEFKSEDTYNAATFVMNNYINAGLNLNKTNWENGVGTFSMFNKIYLQGATMLSDKEIMLTATSANTKWLATQLNDDFKLWIYVANEQNILDVNLPAFEGEHTKTLSWNYNDKQHVAHSSVSVDTRMSTIYADLHDDSWVNMWEYNGSRVALNQVSAYRSRYYYEGKNTIKSGDSYDYVVGDWYYSTAAASLFEQGEDGEVEYLQLPEFGNMKENKNIFRGWILDVSAARNNGYTVSQTDLTFTLTHTNGKQTTITSSGAVKSVSNLWYIESIGGYEILDQMATNPIIKAKIGAIYASEINNTGSYWYDLKDDSSVAGVITSYTNYRQEVDGSNGAYVAYLEVADNLDYAYPFMNSVTSGESGVFFHQWDYNVQNSAQATKGYYSVYNYGHYITGWKVYLKSANKYLILSNGDWKAVSATAYSPSELVVPTDKLTNFGLANFSVIAAEADNVYCTEIGVMDIVFYPQWSAVYVNVELEGRELLSSSMPFGTQTYTLENIEVPVGTSLMAYAYIENNVNNSLIALQGRWNYAGIDADYYVYSSDSAISRFGNVLYTITVYPVIVDDVYLVELEGARVNLHGQYELEEGYIYNVRNGYYDGDKGVKHFTYLSQFANAQSQYVFAAYNSQPLVDNYILDLLTYKTMYLDGINGDDNLDFDIFKKVYYTTSSYVLANESCLETQDATNRFFMYLAHDQECGYMPVFVNPYNDLIFWENAEESEYADSRYAYITEAMLWEDEDHSDEIAGFELHEDEFGVHQTIWQFTDGDAAVPEKLIAHYFRKNYLLNVKTTFEGVVDRRGYVLFDIHDELHENDNGIEDRSGKYLAISENDEMEIYSLNLNDITWFMLKNMNEYSTKLIKAEGEEVAPIRLFAGCDITMYVRDQSKDYSSMETGNFDEMIGFKYKTYSQSISPEEDKTYLFSLDTLEDEVVGYKYKTEALTWVEYDYKNKTVLSIDVKFENILYNTIIKMQDGDTGLVSYAKNEILSANQVAHSVKGLKFGDKILATYFAFAGFKLTSDAFVLNYTPTIGHILQAYDDSTQADGTGAGQAHSFVMDGTWLRLNLYSRYINDYKIYPNGVNEETDIGDLVLQTEAIVFSYGFITRDFDSYTNPENRVINHDNRYVLGDLALARDEENKYSADTQTFNNYIVESSRFENSTYWLVLNDVYYSLWQSELYYYIPSNAYQYLTKYAFPLISGAPSVSHRINIDQIAAMVGEYKEGIIIRNDIRELNLLIDISPYVEQYIYVAADFCNENVNELTQQQALQDPNRGTRIVQIGYTHNDKRAQIQMAVYPQAQFDEQGVFVINYVNSSVQSWTKLENNTLYYPAYVGMNLDILTTSTYSDYESVDVYSIDSNNTTNVTLARCEANESEKKNNGFEYVRFNAKPLHANYVYKLSKDGEHMSVVSWEEMSEYIAETEAYKTSSEKDLYIDASCNALSYEAKVRNSRYIMEVKISGVTKGKSTSIKLVGETAHIITAADYASAKGDLIDVEIIVTLNDASVIDIAPIIADSQTSLGLGEFGSFDITRISTIDGEQHAAEFKDLQTVYQLNLVDDDVVKITFHLKAGYRYLGYKFGTASIVSGGLENSTVTIIEDFDYAYHESNGITQYFLIIEKIEINATLDTKNSDALFKINGNDNNAIVFVDQSITFTQITDLRTERLAYFYYKDISGNRVPLTTDGTITGEAIAGIILTSEMIECCTVVNDNYTLTFYVEIIERYRMTLTLTGAQYLENAQIEFADGNDLALDIPNVVNPVATIYSMYFDEFSVVKMKAVAIVVGKYDIKFNSNMAQNSLNETVTITDNLELNVAVAPKKFAIIVNEWKYENLTQMENKQPVAVLEQNRVSDFQAAGQSFNDTAEVSFIADVLETCKLTGIVISNNDMNESVVIDLSDLNFETAGTITIENYTLRFEKLSSGGYRIVLKYVTKANVTLDLTYTEYKYIGA